ncbi:PLDc_N domain-containing protein [Ornithobacterium rhinotracheale]|uniref:PLDc N-terminal domain-containing protein n=1 Tax=Ornithobacterium rhinotracheale TaxID=28251 RepID=UPI00129CA3BE|nr:PLD nuclease N-terminal domain-containing protein [Ornithobacterium rhinotracheale]MRI63510.1 PLDc_N domain-containing protein [Ornithobacterium rhinotracheale]MRJ11336.1 PLDc_N domain-containing protein [Ornithobacterium rhinotracheale]
MDNLSAILVAIYLILGAFLSVWAIVDCIKTKREYSTLWILVVFFFPLIGAFAYFMTKPRAQFEPFKSDIQSYRK